MAEKTTSAYRRYAIITVFFAYYSMKDLGEEMCGILSSIDKDIKVSESRESCVTLKKSRGATITEDDLEDAAVKAFCSLIKNDNRFASHISDIYEFTFDPKSIDTEFVNHELSFHISGRSICVVLEVI